MTHTLTITDDDIRRWAESWPCTTLRTGAVTCDHRGDLVDLTGDIGAGDVDGHELDAYLDDHQPPALRTVRGTRCA